MKKIKDRFLKYIKEDKVFMIISFLLILACSPIYMIILGKITNYWLSIIFTGVVISSYVLFLLWRYDMFEEIEFIVTMAKAQEKLKKERKEKEEQLKQ